MEALNTQEKYFSKAISVAKQLEIANMLQKAGISPNNTKIASFDKILDVIEKVD
jgi:hypothetical protein